MLPDADELAEVLVDLAVPHEDINDVIRMSRRVTDDPELLHALKQAVGELVGDMGEIRGTVDLPDLDWPSGPLQRFFPLYVLVAALPDVRAYHKERGVPAEVARRTLADVGRNIAAHRRTYGMGGVLVPRWLTLHFHGELYQLGRLQFQRDRVGRRAGAAIEAAGFGSGPGDLGLGMHIPDFLGPLTREACDRSLALAREFFARHYPEEPYRAVTCASWLLDPQLRQYLPEDSNIVRFQERFRVSHMATEAEDDTPIRFVFGTDDVPLDRLPRRTVLQRAIVDHLRAGGHWYVGHGWFPL
ncbi:acyltransferase domain-containing protein [Streptomyces griseus]|uniref:acyltransferase domain-containing protein n=1 Tax=Streptomyces griseus TaxID=1911 RepID=UPI000561E8DC|nr:acyltransferase domain-containing protein [Streptomyces griseus]